MSTVRKNRILVIDDDPLNLLVLEGILGNKYELLTASSEQNILEVAETFRPDLIMLDLSMQSANGYELCKQLKANQNLKLTKIVLVSSKAMLKDRLIGYEAGADDYLSKPFDPEELLAKVGVFIRLKSVEEIDRVKDDLINIFSHETRTPLNAIIGFAKLLNGSSSLAEDEKEFVKLILESGISLLSLCNKTVLLSNLRKEKKDLSISYCDFAELLKAALKKLPEKLKDKNIKLETDLHSEIISADHKLIETAIFHLLDNAHKFSPEKSIITLKSSIEENGDFLFTVKDSGSGIAPGRLPSIFDEFGIEDVGHHGRGHGLSLAIVKYIMEAHRGEVRVKNNQPPPGCSFTLVFPKESIMKK